MPMLRGTVLEFVPAEKRAKNCRLPESNRVNHLIPAAQLQARRIGRSKRIHRKVAGFQLLQPLVNEPNGFRHIQMIMQCRIFRKICPGELE